MSKRLVLGGAVKAIREEKAKADPDFRGSRFSIKCLMTPGHLCNIEQGRKQPPEDVIHRIAAHLGVPVEAISYVTQNEAAA
jgi:transcriptional regulator with XRE-family HTH domain